MRLWPPPRTRSRQAVTSSAPPHASVWERRRYAVPGSAFVPGWAFVRAVVAEFSRAAAATHRYQQLKSMASARDTPATDTARRIYMEFYSD
jgi:hypothetical protein